MAGAAVLAAAAVVAGAFVVSGARQATQPAPEPPATTAQVVRGTLSAMVSVDGTLTYRAQADGSPYPVINRARGTYTALPEAGDKVDCGDVLDRVDDKPVLLLCGAVPAYRDLHSGDVGNDVRQLNQNLHLLGDDARAGVKLDPTDNVFTANTAAALEILQHDREMAATGVLAIADAVFLPEPVRIAQVMVELGGTAQPGDPVLNATSDTLEVQAALDPSQRSEVREGDRAQIILPGNTAVTGTVDRLGRVAQVPAGQNATVADATIPVYFRLDDPQAARGFDRAPVQVDIATQGVDGVLSVPVTALVGKAGNGFAVEVARPDGRRELVAVKLGLFDTGAGRVEVQGDLVVVPSP